MKPKMSFFKGLLGNQNKRIKNFLSLDIGTELVKVLLLEIDYEKETAFVIGQSMIRQKIGNMSSGAVSDIDGVIETCQKAIDKAKAQGGVKNVEKTIIGIAGELVKGTTTTVHYQRANPEKRIDFAEVKNIIEKVQLRAFDRIKKQLSWETGEEDINAQLINATIVNVKIDGYIISNPIGFQGKNVSIGVFNAYAPMVHLGALQKIADELELEIVAIATEPYAIAQSINQYNKPEFGAIIVDIGGGTTDIALVRNGGLEGTVMFALGGRAFTKRLSSSFNIPFRQAEDLKLNYSRGKISPEVANRIEAIFWEDLRVWLTGFKISLESFAKNDMLPSQILLCGGGTGLPGIKKILETSHWEEDLPMPENLKVNYLQPKDILNVADKTKDLRSPQSVAPMALANLFLSLNSEKDNLISNILGKTIENIQD